jgi:hypothetical protein
MLHGVADVTPDGGNASHTDSEQTKQTSTTYLKTPTTHFHHPTDP